MTTSTALSTSQLPTSFGADSVQSCKGTGITTDDCWSYNGTTDTGDHASDAAGWSWTRNSETVTGSGSGAKWHIMRAAVGRWYIGVNLKTTAGVRDDDGRALVYEDWTTGTTVAGSSIDTWASTTIPVKLLHVGPESLGFGQSNGAAQIRPNCNVSTCEALEQAYTVFGWNASGSTITAPAVVCTTGTANRIKTCATTDDPRTVLGIVTTGSGSIVTAAGGSVVVAGRADAVACDGTINIGDLVRRSVTTAGRVEADNAAGAGDVIGIADTTCASNLVDIIMGKGSGSLLTSVATAEVNKNTLTTAADVNTKTLAYAPTVGTVYHVFASGTIQVSTGGSDTFTHTVLLGGTVVCSSTVTNPTTTSAVNYRADYYLTVRTAGSSGVVECSGTYFYHDSTPTAGVLTDVETNTTAIDLDGTPAVVIKDQIAFSASNATNKLLEETWIVDERRK
jgi:hypothetical protein